MTDDIPRCLLLAASVLAGGFFSGCETAFSFCNEVRIRLMADNGEKQAIRLVKLLDKFDRTVVTLLVAINIIHVVAASVATVMLVSLMGHNGSVVATVVMALITFIFSETIPKNIAKANSDGYALWAAGPILLLSGLLIPITAFLAGLGELVTKTLHVSQTEPSVTEEEFAAMVDGIQNEGLIEANEKEIIKSSIAFSDISVGSIMTPREQIVGIDIGLSQEDLKDRLLNNNFSRYPVYNERRDRVVGILMANSCLYHMAAKEPIDIRDYMEDTLVLSPSVTAADALQAMRIERSHFAVIMDDHDEIVGILTMDDVLEKLVGEIRDEITAQPRKGKSGDRTSHG